MRLFLGPRYVNHASIGSLWGGAGVLAGLPLGRRYVNHDISTGSAHKHTLTLNYSAIRDGQK